MPIRYLQEISKNKLVSILNRFYKINILYFGRLSPLTKCNLLPVIDMVCEAQKSSNKKIKLTIAGYGASYANVLRAISKFKNKEIEILNNVSDEKKKSLFYEADIFIAPSDNTQETFGISLPTQLQFKTKRKYC